MASSTYRFERGHHSGLLHAVRWKRALQAGLIVGAILFLLSLFLLSRGIPWIGSGAIDPAVMGRDISPGREATPLFFFSVMSLR